MESLSDKTLQQLAATAKPRLCVPGTMLCRRGDIGDRMYVLVVGTCEVIVSDEHQQERVIKTLEAPQYFGEMTLLGERKALLASVQCVGQCDLFELSAEDFDRIVGAGQAAKVPDLVPQT